jgi:hypothetical protein
VPGTGQLPEVAFSPDFFTAQERFRHAARAGGWELEAHAISAQGPQGRPLAIDVALFGSEAAPRALVVSSGLHGVEGFLGSAVQLAMLSQGAAPAAARLVLLHGLNPFGFAWLRRCNARNIDLNRNFLLPGERYDGAPPLYAQLDRLFNPQAPPARWHPRSLPLLWALLRYDHQTLARTLPVGQYEFPLGLFFGGHEPAEEHCILADHLERWIGRAETVLHLDLHTGLGRWGRVTLLVDERPSSPGACLLRELFAGEQLVTTLAEDGAAAPRAAYVSRGSWNRWCVHRFAGRLYAFVTVEVGTYSMFHVASALRTENMAWHHGGACRQRYDWTRRKLAQVFAPANLRWRRAALARALRLVMQACAWASMEGRPAPTRLATA